MSDYVTVVSVDNGVDKPVARHLLDTSETKKQQTKDSQFITVLSIGDSYNGESRLNIQIEEVVVYRLPGERLGFGLKFQGGTKSAENIQRLFIQSCASDSPASRAISSWGSLREGDEIVEIDGIDVTTMTRLECVKCLKESNLAITLLVRNGEGKAYDVNVKENIEIKGDKKNTPPPPPPVPPRKINRKKSQEKITTELQGKITTNDKPFTPPPDAEFYINLFSDENEFKLRESESDDTGSTISTVVDNFSLNSNSDLSMTSNLNSITTTSTKSIELAKVLKSFTLLEKEFNVDNSPKLEECLLRLQPPISFQDDNNKIEKNNDVKIIQVTGEKVLVKNENMEKSYENVLIKSERPDKHIDTDYVNVHVKTRNKDKNYENIDIKKQKEEETNEVKTPPTPLPRQGVSNIITRSAIPIIPLPRAKQNGKVDDLDEIHECKVAIDENSNVEKCSELPRLIKFVPKIVSTEPTQTKIPEIITSNQYNKDDVSNEIVVKKCIKVISDDNDDSYVDSSSDEDEEKVYEPGAMEKRDSSDTFSDEDGEKLGPPELLNSPGPSEAYFNFHWSPNMLPTIGEVEEEFSSLEPQTGPLLIIDNVDESTDRCYDKIPNISDRKSTAAITSSFSETKLILLPEIDKTKIGQNNSNRYNGNCGNGTVGGDSACEKQQIMKKNNDVNVSTETNENGKLKCSSDNEIKINVVNNVNANKLATVIDVNGNDKINGKEFNSGIIAPSNKNIMKNKTHEFDKPEVVEVKLTKKIRSKIAKLTKKSSSDKSEKSSSNKVDTVKETRISSPAKSSKQNGELNNIKQMQTDDKLSKIPKQKKEVANEQSIINHISLNTKHLNVKSNPEIENSSHIVSEKGKNKIKDTGNSESKIMETIESNTLKEDKPLNEIQPTTTFEKKLILENEKDELKLIAQQRTKVAANQINILENVISPDQSKDYVNPVDRTSSINDKKISEIKQNKNFKNSNQNSANNEESKKVERIILGTEHPYTLNDNVINNTMESKSSQQIIKQESSPSMEQNISIISSPILVNDIHISPPTFSRLPPDGHEFPPNFSEPIIITPVLKTSGLINSSKLAKEEKTSSKEDAPPLPKSVPPSTVPRKIYRQNLIITVDNTRQEHNENIIPYDNVQNKKTWSPAVLEDKTVRKEIMITAKNGHITTDINSANNVEMRRRSIENNDAFKKFDTPRRQIGILPSNWRKDEKSEKSVRDKIAMFSNDDVVDKPISGSRKSLNKSTENLLSENISRSRKISDSVSLSLTKKAQSVENLDDFNRSISSRCESPHDTSSYTTDTSYSSFNSDYSAPYSSKLFGKAYSVENLNNTVPNYKTETPIQTSNKYLSYASPIIPPTYASLPRSKPSSVARTTSFSGYSGGPSYDDRRRTSINNLLEQRKKSMSKLRGLIIPEKTALGEDATGPIIFDLPEIKSKDAQKVLFPFYSTSNGSSPKREPVVPNPRHYTPAYQNLSTPTDNSYKSIFNTTDRSLSSITRSSETKAPFKKPVTILPPVKPPRTSLILASRSSGDSFKSHTDDSEDSDSVFSSKILSPPNSPVVTAAPEKFALTRTLSSETNTSIASSTTSTLTSGSGSQASCSSVGSTPTIDMSRKILKSSSNESYVNRKNILALAKCRSGKDETSSHGRQQRRYDDEDSTDGYDEEEIRRIPKPKQRNSLVATNRSTNGNDSNRPINYRLVTNEDNIVDMVINVASYVEITSDTEGDPKQSDLSPRKITTEFINEERRASFKASKDENKKCKPIAKLAENKTAQKYQEKQTDNSDLAKWVRSEVAKSRKNIEEGSKLFPEKTVIGNSKVSAKISVSENIQKFNNSSSQELPKTPIVIQTKTVSNMEQKKYRTVENRKNIENKANNNVNGITNKSPRDKSTYHERFSSLDSLTSSSSGVSSSQTSSLMTNPNEYSQNLQNTPTDFGSYSSFGSNHSLITPADLQLIIEESDPPLKTSEAFVVVLQRDSPEYSVGVTLAGGADYETKEITIHRILTNSPAYKDGRLRKGDRILSINGLSMHGLTHRESVGVLKTPRPEVVMVVKRSESLINSLSKIKRSSLGSLTSLSDKNITNNDIERRKTYHKSSRSLDLDLELASNEESLNDDCKSMDGAEESTASSLGDDAVFGAVDESLRENNLRRDEKQLGAVLENQSNMVKKPEEAKKQRIIEIQKDNCGLGLAIEGGVDSPFGHKPLSVKKVFMRSAAEKAGKISVGDVILSINDFNTENITRVEAWNYMKSLPLGPVKFVLL